MTVSIDISPLLVSSAGVKTYLYHWLRAMLSEERTFDLRTFPVAFNGEPLVHGTSMFHTWKTVGGLARLSALNRIKWGVGAPEADLFHASQLARHSPNARLLSSTIFDLTYRLHPELHTQATIQCNLDLEEAVLRRCSGIICISESAKRDAVELARLDDRKLKVIYPGVDEAFFAIDETQIEAARNRYGLRKPYVLFAATLEPRKNLGRLLDAWERLAESITEQFDFVVAGGSGWKSEDLRTRLSTSAAVKYLGYVPNELLPGLTAGASVFAYPSLYEGFGLPVAQAMAAGCPVLTSANSSLPEVAGDAGAYADPLSTDSLRDVLMRLLLSPSERERLSGLGRERAQLFRWSKSAAESVAFFSSLLG